MPALGLVALSYVPPYNAPLAVTILVITIGSLAATFVGFNVSLIVIPILCGMELEEE